MEGAVCEEGEERNVRLLRKRIAERECRGGPIVCLLLPQAPKTRPPCSPAHTTNAR